MRTDLSNSLKEGMNYLLLWRNRYSKKEYPEKIVLNIFYRKYTMEFIFNDIINCFEINESSKPQVKWTDLNIGFKNLKYLYSIKTTSKTILNLPTLLLDINRDVGNTNYQIFLPLIEGAKAGNNLSLEEIEYAYLYYLLTDECIILWGALGGTGFSKIETIGKMSGLIIKAPEIESYASIEQILGRFCASGYLKEHYKPLPPNI